LFMAGNWYVLNTSCLNPFSPEEGTHVPTMDQIIWNWDAVSYATGYKWNTTDDYSTAIDLETETNYTETDLICNTTYTRYVWAYNGCGSSLVTTLTSQTSPGYCIGGNYGGGIIFYIDNSGEHGLIAATSDFTADATWGCLGFPIGTSSGIGTGQANTTAIVTACNTEGIAARLCDNLIYNGYSDWFLPSADEIQQMYIHRSVIGGFASDWYWCSSEINNINANSKSFSGGSWGYTQKSVYAKVRAVRAF
jgi:hypothetical protein